MARQHANVGHEVREAAVLASIVVNLRGRGGTVTSLGPRTGLAAVPCPQPADKAIKP